MSTNKQFSIDINNCGFIDPQIQLAGALANHDIRDFRIALDMGAEPELPDDERHMSVFEQALRSHGCVEFVEECLRRGCKANLLNQHLNKAAINFAADSKDPKILASLLRHKDIQVDRKYSQLTPLNSLAKNLTPENANEVTACIKLLLNYGASPNIPDQREMTPVHYVLKNRKIDEQKKRELLQVFLERADLDLDSYRDGEARAIIKEEYPEFQMAIGQPKQNANDISFDTLVTHLRAGDEEKFLQLYRDYQLNTSQRDNTKNSIQEQNTQLLIESIKRGLHQAFDAIREGGDFNVNGVHGGNTPAEIAAIWGNWRALQRLLVYDELHLRQQDQLLITIIRKLDEVPLQDFCDYNKCFYVLLDSEKIDVNDADPSGSTPLHYAVKYRNRKAMQELLKRGAYIGTQSVFGDLPIDGVHPDLLEEHFDNCINTNGLKAGDENYEILMNYMNLMPPTQRTDGKHSHGTLREEMAPIAFMAESKEHKHLLQHPLITSFLFLKWHRLSVMFYINFLLYTFFAVSIIVHTVLKFRDSDHEALITLFGILSLIGISYLIIREIIQFIMSPTSYIRSPTNYMELLLIVLAIMTCAEPSYDQETKRVIAVFTILLVALELCLLVGSLPVLSISTHMLMLRAVSKSFLKSFTLYSIFVITFSLCFYILFGKPQLDDKGQPVQEENGDFNKFGNPGVAVIKTIVMLTGEFDAGDLGMDSFSSYLVFLLFVVFMSIVLFNLLNGLAVSDTQAIKSQAELNGSICRTNLLSRYEEVLTGRSGRASFIVNHEPFRTICRRLMNLYPNYIAGRQIAILPNDNNKVMIPIANSYEMKELGSNKLSHGNGLRNSKSKFLPLNNTELDNQKKLLDPPVQFLPCCCACVTGKCSEMDTRTVKLAQAVIERKSNNQKARQQLQTTERRLQNIEHKLERMFEILQDMQGK